ESSTLKVELDALKNRVHTLEEENGRLVNRASQILGKYSRVDPVEHQLLKDQISVFTVKFDSSESVFAEEKAKLVEEKNALETQLASVTLERDSAKAESEASVKEVEKLKASSDGKFVETAQELETVRAKLKDTVTNANNKMRGMIDRHKEANSKVKELTERVRVLEEELEQLRNRPVSASVDPVLKAQSVHTSDLPVEVQPVPVMAAPVVEPVPTPAADKPAAASRPHETSQPTPKRHREEEPAPAAVSESAVNPEIADSVAATGSTAKRAKIDDSESHEAVVAPAETLVQQPVAVMETIVEQPVAVRDDSVDTAMTESVVNEDAAKEEEQTHASSSSEMIVDTEELAPDTPLIGGTPEEGEVPVAVGALEQSSAGLPNALEGIQHEPVAESEADVVESITAVVVDEPVVDAPAVSEPEPAALAETPKSAVIKIQRTPVISNPAPVVSPSVAAATPPVVTPSPVAAAPPPSTPVPAPAAPIPATLPSSSTSTPSTPVKPAIAEDKTALLRQKLALMQKNKAAAAAAAASTPVKSGATPPSVPVAGTSSSSSVGGTPAVFAPLAVPTTPVVVARSQPVQTTPTGGRFVRPNIGRPVMPPQQSPVAQHASPQASGAMRMMQQQGLPIRPRGVRPVPRPQGQPGQQQQQGAGGVGVRPQGNRVRQVIHVSRDAPESGAEEAGGGDRCLGDEVEEDDESSTLKVELDALKNRVHTLEEENGRLVNRASQILGKYSRVDPVEHQLLKDQISVFTVKFDSIESVFAEEKAKLVEEKNALETQLASVTLERDSAKAESEASLKEVEKLKASSDGKFVETAQELETVRAKLKDTVTNANNKMRGMIDRHKEANSKVKELTERVRVLEEELEQLRNRPVSASVDPVMQAQSVHASDLPVEVQSVPVMAAPVVEPLPTPAADKPAAESRSHEASQPTPKRHREEEPAPAAVSESAANPEIADSVAATGSTAKRAKVDDSQSHGAVVAPAETLVQQPVAVMETIVEQPVAVRDDSVDAAMTESVVNEDAAKEEEQAHASSSSEMIVDTEELAPDTPLIGGTPEEGEVPVEVGALEQSLEGIQHEPVAESKADVVESTTAVVVDEPVVDAPAVSEPEPAALAETPKSAVIKIQRTPVISNPAPVVSPSVVAATPPVVTPSPVAAPPPPSTPVPAPAAPIPATLPSSLISTPSTPVKPAIAEDKTALLRQKLALMQKNKAAAAAAAASTSVKSGVTSSSVPVAGASSSSSVGATPAVIAPLAVPTTPVGVARPHPVQTTPTGGRFVRPNIGRPVMPPQQSPVAQHASPQASGAMRLMQQQGLPIRPRGVRPVPRPQGQPGQQQQQGAGGVGVRPQGNRVRQVRPRPPPPSGQ
ncbi:hypothetical protein HDU98_010218, partial [Podochytrium sp. JEL0797]